MKVSYNAIILILGKAELNYSCFDNVIALPTCALVYYVRGLACDLKFYKRECFLPNNDNLLGGSSDSKIIM